MMSLATLWSVVRTLDGNWTSPIGASLARAWFPGVTPVYVRGSANFVFRLQTNGVRFFLRFAHESERTRAAIEQEMELLRWLAESGLRVNEPVATVAGDRVVTFETELGRFHAVMLTDVAGEHLEMTELDPPMFEAWGRAIGDLHARFDRLPSHLRRSPAWSETLAWAMQAGGFLAREADALAGALGELPLDSASFGPIHTDLELDNLLWNGSRFGFVDFDEYTTGWRAADIAKALNDLDADARDPRFDAFVRGYRERHALPAELVAALPVMTRLFDLGMYLRLRRALAEPPDEPGRDAFANLISNLTGWMQRYEARTLAGFAM